MTRSCLASPEISPLALDCASLDWLRMTVPCRTVISVRMVTDGRVPGHDRLNGSWTVIVPTGWRMCRPALCAEVSIAVMHPIDGRRLADGDGRQPNRVGDADWVPLLRVMWAMCSAGGGQSDWPISVAVSQTTLFALCWTGIKLRN